MKNSKPLSGTTGIRIIVSGGGTAGHIYPAVSLVETLTHVMGEENTEVLFVGAQGKMEMKKVPELGYKIIGLPIIGLQRRLTLKNLLFPFKLADSMLRALKIVRNFKPDIVVGFGGYASTPIIKAAQICGIPTVLWEGNSYAGMANKMLASKANKVCVAYAGMERFFDMDKIVVTGSPVRGNFLTTPRKESAALNYFGFTDGKPILMITGGSLGARVLNESVLTYLDILLEQQKINLIWQTGSFYIDDITKRLEGKPLTNVWVGPFIDRMDYAYSIADMVISRAGGSAVAELSLLGMPTIFVPSSGVAENHQYLNAMALVEKGAALIVSDEKAVDEVMPLAVSIITDSEKLADLGTKIKEFAHPDAASDITNVVLSAAGNNKRVML